MKKTNMFEEKLNTKKKKNTPGLNVQSWGGGGRERTAKSIEQR